MFKLSLNTFLRKTMTFRDKYDKCKTWHDRVLVMNIYHTLMTLTSDKWTVSKTAAEFGVSVGLTSENIRLANFINTHPEAMKITSRQDALRKIR